MNSESTIDLRKTGISVVGEVPWGTHFCHFYETKQDLLDTLVPYFKAGLESNEFCLWVVSDADLITVEEAKGALAQAVPDLERHITDENIEILDGLEWYLEENVFNLERVTRAWDAKLKRALARGYDGMRVSGDTFWLAEKDWKDFSAYEKQLNESITDQPMTVLCTYPLAKSGAAEVLDVVQAHQFAIARRQGEWEVIETPELIQAKAEIRRLNEELEQRVVERTGELAKAIEELTDEMSVRKQSQVQLSLAHQRLSYHVENTPLAVIEWDKDLLIKRWSKRAEEVFGWKASEALGINMYDPDFHIVYEEDAQAVEEIAGQLVKGTVNRNLSLNRNYTKDGNVIYCEWYNSVLRGEDGNVITILSLVHDVTERKQAEEALDERLRFETLVTELSAAFANLSPNEVDSEIDKWLQSLAEFLGVDRATFFQLGEDRTTLYRSHSYTVSGIEPLPSPPIGLKDQFPWIMDQLRQGVTVKWSRIPDDMPEEAAKEKEYAARLGVKSGLNIPVLMGGSVICAITFTSIVSYRDWPDAMVARLRLVGEIFAAALERKRAETALHAREEEFRAIVENTPDHIARYDTSFRRTYVNPAFARTFDLPAEALIGKPILSSLRDAGVEAKDDELAKIRQRLEDVFETGESCEFEVTVPMPTGRRYYNVRFFPERNLNGSVINVLAIARDITERKVAEEELKKEKEVLDKIFDNIPVMIGFIGNDGDVKLVNPEWERTIGWKLKELQEQDVDIFAEAYPDQLYRQEVLDFVAEASGEWVDLKIRVRDGRVIDAACAVVHLSDGTRVAIARDITERKRAEEALRRSEDRIRLIIDTIPTMAWTLRPDGIVDFVNQRWLDYTGEVEIEDTNRTVHPEDLPGVTEKWLKNMAAEEPSESELRIRRADGEYRWFLVRTAPLRDEGGNLVKWYGVSTDIEDLKRAEEALKESQRRLEEAQRIAHVGHWERDLETRRITWSNEIYCILGLPLERDSPRTEWLDAVHPEDRPRLSVAIEEMLRGDRRLDMEFRILRPNREVRFLHSQGDVIRDERGRPVRMFGTAQDITERKLAEDSLREALLEINRLKDQLYKENIALREEIVSASMFEEIIGTSPALQEVLVLVAKVAPTDSTVLITGETGTGKELIARAIHKRSNRAAHVFMSLNCAAIPPALIAAELFGHEKGAFTGAVQQRLGRFELAEGGTLFLDEIGELPAETQIALLRVLQEHEFERVGGTKAIQADVRVIAATNRDLHAAIAAGTFRRDLFYRLNVFPIEMPSLRDRREDIPLLVEYFIHRYASKMGKKIRRIDKGTLNRLASSDWPGNIRELQNVIERSVILNETETFTIDKSWLSHKPHQTPQEKPFSDNLATREKEMIEAALAESRGRVSGPSGAAAKLGIPPSTLDSKIRALKINKHRFKTT
jgi:PAS domain S-box-containing protein